MNPYRHPISTPVPELQGIASIAAYTRKGPTMTAEPTRCTRCGKGPYWWKDGYCKHSVSDCPPRTQPTTPADAGEDDLVERLRHDDDLAARVEAATTILSLRAQLEEARGKALDEAAPTLCSAFRTTVSGDGEYTMVFKFRSMEEVHRADDEWHTLRGAK